MVAARTAYLGPVLKSPTLANLSQQGALPVPAPLCPAQDRLMLERPWDGGPVAGHRLGRSPPARPSPDEVTVPRMQACRHVGAPEPRQLRADRRGDLGGDTRSRIYQRITATPAHQSVDATLLIGNDRPVRRVLYKHGSTTGGTAFG